MKPEIVKASPEDIEHFARGETWPTMMAWVAKLGDEPVALFGLARNVDARWFVFFDITEAARPYKVTIVKMSRWIMTEACRMGLRYVYAQVDANEPNAMRLLESMGFSPDPRTLTLMRWENERVR